MTNWVRYNSHEAQLVHSGLDSDRPDLMTPTFDRAAKSGLKMSLLIAAARNPTDDEFIIIEEKDIVRAFYYIEQWLPYTLDLMENIGVGASERQMEKIYKAIIRKPGITRSKLMQNFHLTSRDASLIFDTLEQRGVIIKQKVGRAEQYRPAGVG